MNNTLNQNKDDNLNNKKNTETTWYNKSNISRGINPSIDKLMENKKKI